MGRFHLKLEEYPDLAIDASVHLVESATPSMCARIVARGEKPARQRFRADFKDWCAKFRVDATHPEPNARRAGATTFLLDVSDWSVIIAFVVQWIGIDRIAEALNGVEKAGAEIKASVDALRADVSKLTRLIEDLHRTTEMHHAWKIAAAKATLSALEHGNREMGVG